MNLKTPKVLLSACCLLAVMVWSASRQHGAHASRQRGTGRDAVSTFVHRGAKSVVIRIFQGTPVRYRGSIVMREPATIARLTQLLDKLPRVPRPAAFSCPAYHSGWYYALRFIYGKTKRLDVKVFDSCPPTATAHGVTVGANSGYLHLRSFLLTLLRHRAVR
jgi:hypothetical protein